MTEVRCRYDRDAGEYVQPDGETCDAPRRDHCDGKRCSNHLAWGERNCPRCVGRTRNDIRRIHEYAPLLDAAALESRSINSEAANLAGPACDVEAWSWRKVAAMQGVAWHLSQDEDEPESFHPFTVLTYWAWQTVGAYQLTEPDVYTIGNAADLLEKQLHRIANDADQDFAQLASEVRKCRERMDGALSIRKHVQRGVPCPTCIDAGVKGWQRLVLEYAHWCNNPDCTQIHEASDKLDVWVCPKDRDHWWNPAGYANLIEDRKASA